MPSDRQALDAYHQDTGRRLSALQAVSSYIAAAKLLPDNLTLSEAVSIYRQTVAAVQRKPLAEAVQEFCDARRPKAISRDGKRSALSPVYVQDTERQLAPA